MIDNNKDKAIIATTTLSLYPLWVLHMFDIPGEYQKQ
jgi:hypothetical protein